MWRPPTASDFDELTSLTDVASPCLVGCHFEIGTLPVRAHPIPVKILHMLASGRAHLLSQGTVGDQFFQGLHHLLESSDLETGDSIDDGRCLVVSKYNTGQSRSGRLQRDFRQPFQS